MKPISAGLWRCVMVLLLGVFSFQGPKLQAADAPDSGQDFGLDIQWPAGEGPFPAVLLLHGCAGLTPKVREGLRNHADFLVQAGYAAVILDSFSRRGKAGGLVCGSFEELGYARHYRLQDAYEARNILASLPRVDDTSIFLIGQSNGGSVALRLAAGDRLEADNGVPPFRGIVAFYPWCGALSANPKLVSPLLVLGAADDDWVSPEGCRQRAPRAEGAPMEVVTYEGARHSFDLPIARQVYAGHLLEADPEATEDSRRRFLAFFEGLREN